MRRNAPCHRNALKHTNNNHLFLENGAKAGPRTSAKGHEIHQCHQFGAHGRAAGNVRVCLDHLETGNVPQKGQALHMSEVHEGVQKLPKLVSPHHTRAFIGGLRSNV